MDYSLIVEDPAYESFLKLYRELDLVKIAPAETDEPGTYEDAFIRFFFIDEPQL